MSKKKKSEYYCDNCKHISLPPDREPLSECDRYCDKYKEDLAFYDWFWRCDKCCKEFNSAEGASNANNDRQ